MGTPGLQPGVSGLACLLSHGDKSYFPGTAEAASRTAPQNNKAHGLSVDGAVTTEAGALYTSPPSLPATTGAHEHLFLRQTRRALVPAHFLHPPLPPSGEVLSSQLFLFF